MHAAPPPKERFVSRHLGPREHEIRAMLEAMGLDSLDTLIRQTVPAALLTERPLALPPELSEQEALARLAALASENEIWRSYLGMGYHDTHTPPVILRNILENPGWYTAYTPYQAEIAQGRLEALLVFQTLIENLTGMEISNASLLDEATAAAEAMTMAHRVSKKRKADTFVVAADVHPQTLALLQCRAAPLGLVVRVEDPEEMNLGADVFGCLVQYPGTDGVIRDGRGLVERAHAENVLVCASVDLLALVLLVPPGEWGADIVVGSSQRFGVPMGYGGPHAAFLATKEEHRRQLPGRIIGLSRDRHGEPALRMALQTREQHIRRQKATSNICTAQVLLAVCAGMYAVWHGPDGLRAIATRVHHQALALAKGLRAAGHQVSGAPLFDTVKVDVGDQLGVILQRAEERKINLRWLSGSTLTISLDETVTAADLADLLEVFDVSAPLDGLWPTAEALPAHLRRQSDFLQHETFHRYRSETEMLRYLHRLEAKDLALNTSMIPLGSCTMKLNATTEMIPVTWRGFGGLHPFVPTNQARGYQRLFADLEEWLGEITGFDAISLQPNAGSQGEYAGLLTIRAWHHARGDQGRTVCLIPTSAHGTNPASAVMAGMEVVTVACDDHGNIDVADLRAKADAHASRLAALMVTYPSTHGVFEESIREICAIVHANGGQVYMDGANMNALVGLCRPAELGADVCHLNLHKTFCIPHGGGGPGMGPIGVRAHLAPYLPGHPLVPVGQPESLGTISAAPWGSPSILPISWAYIAMMGGEGLTLATKVAILNANYVASRLDQSFPVLYRGAEGRVAHECILDLRTHHAEGIAAVDVAKRLMDYGFHAPTMSWPVTGTLMVEPTESESKEELDRFCEAMLLIHGEICDLESGALDPADNPLGNAPHTAAELTADSWTHPYPRSRAAWPAPWLKGHKYWPTVGRVDDVYGDRNLICSCDAWPEAAE